jgi:hypothetical protein
MAGVTRSDLWTRQKAVPGEVEAGRGPVVLPLLAEAVRESRQAAHAHPHRQVLPFHATCRSSICRDRSGWVCNRLHNVWWRIALFAFPRRRLDLDDLREVHAIRERSAYGGSVRLKSVRGHLKPAGCGCGPQALDKNVRSRLIAPAQCEVQNEFGLPLDRHEAVRIAPFVGFLFLNESPNLIALNIGHRHIGDEPRHALTALAGRDQGLKKRRVVNPADAFRAACPNILQRAVGGHRKRRPGPCTFHPAFRRVR